MKRLVETAADRLDAAGAAYLRRASRSDAQAWHNEFGALRDVSGLDAERNVFRYLAVYGPVLIRRTAAASEAELLRVVAAGAVANAPMVVSSEPDLDAQTLAALEAVCVSVVVENDESWLTRVARPGVSRVRLLGAPASSVTAVTGGRPDLAVYANPATESGRIELLPFLREQAVAVTAHRFGTPDHLTDALM